MYLQRALKAKTMLGNGFIIRATLQFLTFLAMILIFNDITVGEKKPHKMHRECGNM